MSFPSVLFDLMIRELGELVSLRNAALARPEIAKTPSLAEALEALKNAVSAVGHVASATGDRAPEVGAAQVALAEARRAFAAVPPPWEGRRPSSPASSGTVTRPRPA